MKRNDIFTIIMRFRRLGAEGRNGPVEINDESIPIH